VHSLAASIVSGCFADGWIYWVAPLAGAVVGGGLQRAHVWYGPTAPPRLPCPGMADDHVSLSIYLGSCGRPRLPAAASTHGTARSRLIRTRNRGWERGQTAALYR
jgi:hypothetical protein